MKYVGYHIFDGDDQMACCESAYCEEWLDKKIDEMFPQDTVAEDVDYGPEL